MGLFAEIRRRFGWNNNQTFGAITDLQFFPALYQPDTLRIDNAETFLPIHRAINLVSNDVARLPVKLERKNSDGEWRSNTPLPPPPTTEPLDHTRPTSPLGGTAAELWLLEPQRRSDRKNAGVAGAVALVGIGLLSIGMSNFANRSEAVPSVQRSNPNIIGVVLEHDRTTGRWKNRLLAIQGDGKILELETNFPQPRWKPFEHSP